MTVRIVRLGSERIEGGRSASGHRAAGSPKEWQRFRRKYEKEMSVPEGGGELAVERGLLERLEIFVQPLDLGPCLVVLRLGLVACSAGLQHAGEQPMEPHRDRHRRPGVGDAERLAERPLGFARPTGRPLGLGQRGSGRGPQHRVIEPLRALQHRPEDACGPLGLAGRQVQPARGQLHEKLDHQCAAGPRLFTCQDDELARPCEPSPAELDLGLQPQSNCRLNRSVARGDA